MIKVGIKFIFKKFNKNEKIKNSEINNDKFRNYIDILIFKNNKFIAS